MSDFPYKARFEDVLSISETDKALLVEIEGNQFWVPKSQIDDDSEVWLPQQEGTLITSEWWAQQRGLL